MGKPTSYVGTALFDANVAQFSGKLDPRNWSTNAPEIWLASYLIDPSATVVPPGTIPSPLPVDRTTQPTPVPTSGVSPVVVQSWDKQLFFEDVLFGGYEYRNILLTSFNDASGAAVDPLIDFQYQQYECLNTASVDLDDGGVDVDNGGSHCQAVPGHPEQVQIEFSKTVRFTQPDYAVEEVNALAAVLVPLALDMWLYTALL